MQQSWIVVGDVRSDLILLRKKTQAQLLTQQNVVLINVSAATCVLLSLLC